MNRPALRYPDLESVLEAHTFIMERTGEPSAPLCSPHLIESALARPQQAAHYQGADLVRQACILMVALAQAQAFVSGNKRTAMATALGFLTINRVAFEGDSELLAVLLDEAADAPTQEDAITTIEEWIRPQIRPRA